MFQVGANSSEPDREFWVKCTVGESFLGFRLHTIMSNKFHFQSKSTKYYVTSTNNDKDGHDITTTDGASSVPADTILSLNPSEIPGTVYIIGAAGLYVSLGEEVVGTRLRWSKQKYAWQILATPEPEKDLMAYPALSIVSADRRDLYWFDEFGIGQYVIVKDGKVPPESEWFVTHA